MTDIPLAEITYKSLSSTRCRKQLLVMQHPPIGIRSCDITMVNQLRGEEGAFKEIRFLLSRFKAATTFLQLTSARNLVYAAPSKQIH